MVRFPEPSYKPIAPIASTFAPFISIPAKKILSPLKVKPAIVVPEISPVCETKAEPVLGLLSATTGNNVASVTLDPEGGI